MTDEQFKELRLWLKAICIFLGTIVFSLCVLMFQVAFK